MGIERSGAERMDLQFRAEFFNLFNIVNMGLPANILGVSTTHDRRCAVGHHQHDEWLWPDQQDCRYFAPDSVLTEADLLAANSGRRDRPRRPLAPPPLCYKGLAFRPAFCRAANLRFALSQQDCGPQENSMSKRQVPIRSSSRFSGVCARVQRMLVDRAAER